MCGILFTNDPGIDEDRFRAALSRMRHRGPDDTDNVSTHGALILGHERLAVLDPDPRSRQPFYSADGRYAIVYNGEIYNFRDLAYQHGIPTRTTSDTEVLVELYARLGAELLGHLEGMFAFVIADLESGEYFAARDRLGIKPLYYADTGDGVVLASELEPVRDLAGCSRVDEVGLRQYRKLRTFFGGRTLYEGLSMFPPAHFSRDGELHRYWALPEGPQDPPSDEEIDALLRRAVSRRMVSDVPVGSYLSGGLDSSLIAALSGVSDTWTVGFPDANEFPWARAAAEQIGVHHTEVQVDTEEFLDLAREMLDGKAEPLSVPNEVLIYRMTREVKARNTVILSGEGADELFFGYDRIFRWAMEGAWDLAAFSARYSYGSHEDLEVVEEVLARYLHLADPVDRVAAFFQLDHLHGLLRRLDRATMLCSVEARVPFVDHALVERMAGVEASFRMKDGVVKAPLKRVARGLLPDEVIDRPKVGFPVPLERIFPDPGDGTTAMDRWLEWNLDTLRIDRPPRRADRRPERRPGVAARSPGTPSTGKVPHE